MLHRDDIAEIELQCKGKRLDELEKERDAFSIQLMQTLYKRDINKGAAEVLEQIIAAYDTEIAGRERLT